MEGLPRPELAAKRRPASECHDGKYEVSSTHSEGEVRSILYVGIDLAKNVLAVHRVNETGAAELRRPKVTRAKLHALIASLPPDLVSALFFGSEPLGPIGLPHLFFPSSSSASSSWA